MYRVVALGDFSLNPRIVKGRRDSGVAFAARGRVGEDMFLLGVSEEAAGAYGRLSVEDGLMLEARALIGRDNTGGVDWAAMGFVHHREFDVWEKTLTREELDRLMD